MKFFKMYYIQIILKFSLSRESSSESFRRRIERMDFQQQERWQWGMATECFQCSKVSNFSVNACSNKVKLNPADERRHQTWNSSTELWPWRKIEMYWDNFPPATKALQKTLVPDRKNGFSTGESRGWRGMVTEHFLCNVKHQMFQANLPK